MKRPATLQCFVPSFQVRGCTVSQTQLLAEASEEVRLRQLKRLTAISLYRLKSFLFRFRWIIVGGTLAVLSVWDLVSKLPEPLVVSAAAVGLGLVIFDLNGHFRAWRSTDFVSREAESFHDLVLDAEPGGRYRVWNYPNGSFAYDKALTLAIEEGLVARKAPTGYVVPPQLAPWGKRYVDWVFAQGRTKPYDGPILGWGSNIRDIPEVTTNGVELIPSTYYQHIGSDHLATVDIKQDGDALSNYGRRLFIDRHNRLRDFRESWLLNGIGTSALAFTSDGMLVVIGQDQRNMNSNAQLAPSGSGALEPTDMGGSDSLPLKVVAANGGNRELREESSTQERDILSSHFLGFGRWLNKAGRPELFTLTFLSVDSHALRARAVNRDERQYVKDRDFVALNGKPESWDANRPDTMLPTEYRHAMSVPLAAGLSLLAEKWNILEEHHRGIIARTDR